ncbi:UNVERIFIED_CONTAM: hypothetical protein Slati_3835500 [Sesamum latifolium]|uniref:DUF4283 domain-containing protein n=1 Tax=Sesamum latifolium TaxID=2727402 RepID=A0AAW2TKD5_9LAMI
MDLEAERLADALVLTEEEGEKLIVPSGVWINGTIEQDGYYLVGRLLSSKSYRIEYLRSMLASIINPLKGMETTELGGSRLLFKFNHALDRNMMMEGCPWTFERQLLVLRTVESEENPHTVELNWCPFYVHIHGLPMRQRTASMANIIGSRIGKVLEGTHNTNQSWDSLMRIRVALDIRKPIMRFLKISSKSGGQLVYEEGYVEPWEDKQYGPWLCAAIGRGPPHRFSGDSRQAARPALDNLSELLREKRGGGHKCGMSIFDPTGTTNTHVLRESWGKIAELGIRMGNAYTREKTADYGRSDQAMGYNSGPTHIEKAVVEVESSPNISPTHSVSMSPTPKSNNTVNLLQGGLVPVPLAFDYSNPPRQPDQIHGNGLLEKWHFTGFYGEPETSKRKATWRRLVQLSEEVRLLWLCVGDFNEVLDQKENMGAPRPNWQIRYIREALNQSNLSDLDYTSYRYTWWNRRGSPYTVRVRLDRACGNLGRQTKYPTAQVSHLPLVHSDNCPILVDTQPRAQTGWMRIKKCFRFEVMLLCS